MAIGIYIHVPFCLKKCNYCDFISYPYDAGLALSYVSALKKEMAFHAQNMFSEHRRVRSIFLGGGTPTVLPGDLLAVILDNCRTYFSLAEDAEITVECNPGTVTPEKFALLKEAGVNRISIGVQAYQQRLLSLLGRNHSFREFAAAVDSCRQAGFENINFDLIYGIPGQTMRDWQETLDVILDNSPRHISAYCLKIEPDTPLHREVTSGYLVPCDEDTQLEMYWYTIKLLADRGYVHYEISNFALPGMEARHNLIYWHNEEYLGLGPAAHSMLDKYRFSNVESVASYIKKLEKKETAVYRKTRLTEAEQISETVFLGLRLLAGLDTNEFEQRFKQSFFDIYQKQIDKLIGLDLIKIAENRVLLTKKGLPVANEVFAEFI